MWHQVCCSPIINVVAHKKVEKSSCVIVCLTVMQTGKSFRFHIPSSILVVGPSGCGKLCLQKNSC